MRKERVYYIKPFTKAWFLNIWFHYKIVIIFVVFGLILAGAFACEKIKDKTPDFYISYIGDNVNPVENELEDLKGKLDAIVPDINGDKKHITDCSSVFVSNERALSDESVKVNMEMVDIQISSGAEPRYVFLFGGGYEQPYVGDGSGEALYDLTWLAQKYGYGDEEIKKYPDGRVYAISMKDNPLLSFDATDVYLIVTPLINGNKKEQKAYDVAIKMAEYIISRGEYKVE